MSLLLPILGALLLLLTLLTAVPAVVLFIELVCASTRARARPANAIGIAADQAPSLVVLMPAHDEACGIAAPIAAILAQLYDRDRLLVVADNCSDATAQIARDAGAEVIERHDTVRRGKGYALDHGMRFLEAGAPPDIVVIVDADCLVAPQALAHLAERCIATGRPVQALYLMHAPAGAKLGLRIAEFAWLVKNQLRPLGAARMGWPCQLMGTGMAFPWALLRAAPLASGHLVEDMQLGLNLAAAGAAPIFCADALVTSLFPSDAAATTAQRTRWEHGHLSVIASVGPAVLSRAIRRFDASLLAMTLDLIVPPLAALVFALTGLLLLDAAWWRLTGDPRPVCSALLALLLLGVGVLAAWYRDGHRLMRLGELLAVPWYIVAKLPVYVRLFTRRQIEWVRTKRDD